jgi:hypothetical protein
MAAAAVISKDFVVVPFSLADKAQQKLLKGTLEEWRSVAAARYGASNSALTKNPQDVECAKAKVADLAAKEEYFDLIGYYKLAISAASPNANKIFHILYDKNKVIQAVSASTLVFKNNQKELYVDYVISAGWNLPMHGQFSDTATVPLKGAGTALMCSAYKAGQLANCTTLRLKPLAKSTSYYTHIGMQSDQEDFVFVISQNAWPLKLQALVTKIDFYN